MIRSFTVQLNAAHPELPLFEATAIVGSASTAFIRRVPASVGSWHICKVYVNTQYPDGSNVTVEAKVGAEGVWTATLPATETSGRVKSGFSILADGIDENGDPITSYILGIADFAVYTRDMKVQPGAVSYVLKYFDTLPDPVKKGDVAAFDGALKFYNGTEWVPFADLSDYYTKAETDEAIDALAAYYITYTAAGAAFPTRADLINAQTVYSGGAVRTPTRNDYAVVLADETHDGAEYRYIYAVADGETVGQWEAQYPIETNDYTALSHKPKINNVELSGNKTAGDLRLVSQTETPLAIGGGTRTISTQSDNYVALGKDVTIRGASTVALGNSATAGGDNSLAVGPNANAQADNDLVVGGNATARGTQALAVGNNANAAAYSTAIGQGAVSATDGTAIGFQAVTAKNGSGADGTAIGSHAEAPSSGSVAIGHNAVVTTSDAVQIGAGTNNASGSLQFRDKQIITSAGKLNSGLLDKSIPSPSLTFPEMDGEASKGTHTGYFALDDHRHPKDTSKFDTVCPTDSNKKLEWYNGNLRLKTGASSELMFPPNQYDSGETIATQSYVRATVPDMARYALGQTITASATLADRTYNRVIPTANNTADISLAFPAAVSGKARDFQVLITNTAGNTGAITFDLTPGWVIYGDGLDQTIPSGETWLFAVTEVAANEFNTSAVQMEGTVVPEPPYWGLTFTAEQDNSSVTLTKNGSAPTVYLEISIDNGESWSAYTVNDAISLAHAGDEVSFRAAEGHINTRFGHSMFSTYYNYFVLSGSISASGDISSLISSDISIAHSTTMGTNTFSHLFYGCASLTEAPSLPATTLVDGCYRAMFSGCTSLTEAPSLPATTLATSCYSEMFRGCTSLTEAPSLPATTLTSSCYYSMFNGCTSLTEAPSLPATTLASTCYGLMFNGCTSLTEAPSLPATTLTSSCYNSMFTGCRALTIAPEIAATATAENCAYRMFYECVALHQVTVGLLAFNQNNQTEWLGSVASEGTFTCPAELGTNDTIQRGASFCPNGWTVVNI